MPLQMNLTDENLYGRQSIPGIRSLVTDRRKRKAIHADVAFIHRTKNGVYDPLTHYHLLDTLMQITPGIEFRTSDLLAILKTEKPQLVWDSTTVGRVLTDLAENLFEAYGTKPIDFVRRWNGMCYSVREAREHRLMLHRLLDDLYSVCEETLAEELRGEAPKRTRSPLERCPSLLQTPAEVLAS